MIFFSFFSYLVNTLMGADLNNIIKTQRLSDDHVQFLVYQILRGLKVLEYRYFQILKFIEQFRKKNICGNFRLELFRAFYIYIDNIELTADIAKLKNTFIGGNFIYLTSDKATIMYSLFTVHTE